MAPLPKRRHSTRRGGKRKAAISYRLVGLTPCPNCRNPRIPHHVCPHCGHYNGKEVIKKNDQKGKKKS